MSKIPFINDGIAFEWNEIKGICPIWYAVWLMDKQQPFKYQNDK